MVLVGTPAYGSQNHIDYTKTIIEMTQTGIPFSWYGIGNESLITRARNAIISHMYNHNKLHPKGDNEHFSHLFFLDADMYFPPEGYKKLVNSGRDVVGVPVRLKSDQIIYNINGIIEEKDEWMKVKKVGTAALMISDNVIDKLCEQAIAKNDIYDYRSVAGGQPTDGKLYEVCKTGIVDEIYQSEDFFLCHAIIELGFDIYVDTSIKTVHYGIIPFKT